MREIVDLMKEILMLKPETNYSIGLSGLNKPQLQPVKKVCKKIKKEIRLSELMRRH